MMMTEKETVLKWLETCGMKDQCSEHCPYRTDDDWDSPHECMINLMADAYTLLKEQEPRVMASSELQPDDLVWIEVPQSDEIWPALLRKKDWFGHPVWAMCGYALGGYYLHDGYGRDWRCWTAKPTEDQRLAVKWE